MKIAGVGMAKASLKSMETWDEHTTHSCQLPKMKNRERPHPQPALILSFL